MLRQPQEHAGNQLTRRSFLHGGLVGGAACAAAMPGAALPPFTPRRETVKPFNLEELGIVDLQARLGSGEFTSRCLVQAFCERINEIDTNGPRLQAVIELNPEALEIADARDDERRAGRLRGPLHGIPVLVKDNIDTADRMSTTAGSLALLGARPAADAFLVQKLRHAGALILGKTNLSEWANARGNNSTSGWSARRGLTRNPYALDRSASGSSSGSAVAVAANLGAGAIGTETDGSIVSPSSVNGIVGIKPTVGLVSRAGIIPLTISQDTAGPMTRTVRDAVILLTAIAGTDAQDPTTGAASRPADVDYTRFLNPRGLDGMRIGVVRKLFGFHRGVDEALQPALDAIRKAGATLVDPAEIETLGKYGDQEMTVITHELKATLNAYLTRPGMQSPLRSLKEIIEFNENNRALEMPYFGQEIFIKAQATESLDSPAYREALDTCQRMSRVDGIDATLDKYTLDALIAPTEGPAWLIDLVDGDHILTGSSTPAAVAGYPSITVPAGFVSGLPVGLSFFGRAWSEGKLIQMAFAFEQATRCRRPPDFRASASL